MIVFEVVKPIDISYPEVKTKNFSRNWENEWNVGSFYLNIGDFIYLETGYWGKIPLIDPYYNTFDISKTYHKTYILKKLLYMGGRVEKGEGDNIYFNEFWEEKNDINLFHPLINHKYDISEALEKKWIKESISWKRNEFLNNLGI